MQKIIIILLIFHSLAVFLFSNENLTIKKTMQYLAKGCKTYQTIILNNNLTYAANKEAQAVLYPNLSLNTPVEFTDTFTNKESLAVLKGKVRTFHYTEWKFTPSVNLNQLLPTSGTLSMALKDSVHIIDRGSIDHKEYEKKIEMEPQFNNVPAVSLNISQPIIFKNAYQATVNSIRENFKLGEISKKIAVNNLINTTINVFYNLKYLNYNLYLTRLRQKDFYEQYLEAEKKFELKYLTRKELLQAKSALEKAEIDAIDIENNYKNTLELFKKGNSITEKIEFDNVIHDLPDCILGIAVDESQMKTVENNPGVQRNKINLELSKLQMISTRKQFAPVVSLGTELTFDSLLKNTREFPDALNASFNEYMKPTLQLTFNFSWNFFDAGVRKHRLRQNKYSFDNNNLNLKTAIENTYRTRKNILEVIKRDEKYLKYVDLNIEIAELEYENGRRNLILGRITHRKLETLRIAVDNARLLAMTAKINHNMQFLRLAMSFGIDLLPIFLDSAVNNTSSDCNGTTGEFNHEN